MQPNRLVLFAGLPHIIRRDGKVKFAFTKVIRLRMILEHVSSSRKVPDPFGKKDELKSVAVSLRVQAPVPAFLIKF
jgi:hypothetical protein